MRGNLDTRLGKLDAGDYDAIILAYAGVKRLGLAARVKSVLEPELSLPAAGQGALAIEIPANRPDVRAALAPLHDSATAACVLAERAVSRALGGSCQIPLAAFAVHRDGALHLRGLVASEDGRTIARAEVSGPSEEPERLGAMLATALRMRGADRILAALAARGDSSP